MLETPKPPAVVLAGGRARRMGGRDKALVAFAGQPLLARVIARLAPQTAALAVSANGDPTRFAPFAVTVLPDPVSGFPGPLAGILAGMRWAAAAGAAEVLSVPTDTPFLPSDLVWRLAEARRRSGAAIACAASGGQVHAVIGLWDTGLAERLEADLGAGEHRAGAWSALMGRIVVAFTASPDPFLNLNDPAELAAAEERRHLYP